MIAEPIDHNVIDIRRETRREKTDSDLFHWAAQLAESMLPPGYKDYRDRVQRWRDQLTEAGIEIENERKARERANRIFESARQMDAQLRQTEAEKGWERGKAI